MILILSKDFDESTNDVIDWLYHYNIPFKRLNGDDFMKLNHCYTYKLDTNSNSYLNIGNINLKNIDTVWFRRWVSFNFSFKESLDTIKDVEATSLADIKNNIVTEMRRSYKPIFDLLKNNKVNSIPRLENLGVNKITVLEKAKEEGINIPATIISNNKKDLMKFKKQHGKIITKPLGEVITFETSSELFFTRTVLIDDDKLTEIDDYFFPSLFQEYIEKEIEIRSFYLEGTFYSMAIFSQLDAKTRVDFRNYNDDNPNRTVPVELPDSLKSKLAGLMEKLNLNTGSLDLILTPEGRFYFLEVNPVGQFGMTSYPCNYYLEKRIAESLIK